MRTGQGQGQSHRLALVCLLLLFCLPLSVGAVSETLPEGEYQVAVTLSGGTGRVQVLSPTTLTVAGESLTASVTFDSPYYEFMQVGAFRYEPVETENQDTTTFDIPVTLDEPLSVQAQTIAMSQPYLIDYTLYFDSTTLQALQDETDATDESAAPTLGTAQLVLVAVVALALGTLVTKRQRTHKKH